MEEFLQVVHRIFPVFRGLYQDKVANVWCAVNIVIKLRERFAIEDLVRFRYDLQISHSHKGQRRCSTC
jgi:alpha-1,3-glucosyltransferase